jgi:hypothetical protein
VKVHKNKLASGTEDIGIAPKTLCSLPLLTNGTKTLLKTKLADSGLGFPSRI